MTNYKYSATPYPRGTNNNLRTDHDASKPKLSIQCKDGEKAEGNEFWTATNTTKESEAGDIWLHVLSLQGKRTDGWMAIFHMGKKISVLTEVEPTTIVEPEEPF